MIVLLGRTTSSKDVELLVLRQSPPDSGCRPAHITRQINYADALAGSLRFPVPVPRHAEVAPVE
jgi:hypothetical protein